MKTKNILLIITDVILSCSYHRISLPDYSNMELGEFIVTPKLNIL